MLPFLLCMLVLSGHEESTSARNDLAWEFNALALVDNKIVPGKGEIPLHTNGDISFFEAGAGLLRSGKEAPLTSLITAPSEVFPERRISLEAWVVVDQPGAWTCFISAFEDNGDFERGWLLGVQNKRYCFALATEEQGRLEYLSAPSDLRAGEWAHVVGTYDGDVTRLFVNGTQVASSNKPGGKILYAPSHILAAGSYKDANEDYRLAGALLRAEVHDGTMKIGQIRRHFGAVSRVLPKLRDSTQRGVPSRWPADFQSKINGAIDKGATRLMEHQARDGSWGQHHPKYRAGMTVLATYALLKSGIAVGHPSVQSALRFIYSDEPRHTYTAGVTMMLLRHLSEHGDPDNKEIYLSRAEQIIDRVLEWERRDPDTGWGYPAQHNDLSCTQYAALALWSAHEMGIRTPRNVYIRLVNGLGRHYGGAMGEFPAAPGTGPKPHYTQGFRYRAERKDSRSMCTAAITVCQVAEICAGKYLGPSTRRLAQTQLTQAVNWLERNWSMTSDPNGYDFYYYLYGVERAAGLPGMKGRIRPDWYFEGAQFLLGKQKGNGEWASQSDTAFALLFLVKATAAITGKGATIAGHSAEKQAGQLHYSVNGNLDVTLFMTGIDENLLAYYNAQPDPKKGLRIIKVEYLINGKPRAQVNGNPLKPYSGGRFASRIRFKHPQTVTIEVLATVVAEGEYPDNYNKTTEIRSLPLTYKIERSQKELLRDARPFIGENLLREVATTTHASSEVGGRGRGYLTDGIHSTYWQPLANDAHPWVQIDLQRPKRGQYLVLGQAVAARAQLATWNPIKDVKITINGRHETLATMHSDAIIPVRIKLNAPKPVVSIRVQILSRWDGQTGNVGWAEIALER